MQSSGARATYAAMSNATPHHASDAVPDVASPSDPYERAEQTFPTLSDEALDRAAVYGHDDVATDGTILFERGQRGVDFLLIRSGCIEVFAATDHDTDAMIVAHGPGHFTGEVDQLNNRAILVSGRAKGETRFIRVPRANFPKLIAGEPDIGETIMRAFILRRVALIGHGQGGVDLVGPGHGADTQRLRQFLTRNGHPHRLADTESDTDVWACLGELGVEADELPVVILPGGRILRAPSNTDLAQALGLIETLDPDHVHDLAIVGAGPSGLAAAVYGASEGLDTIVLEGLAPGGQAGTSSKIENYLGFPTGISGQALAGRAQVQAQKFGAKLAIARTVTGIDCGSAPYRLLLDDGESVAARAIVVASGARYAKLSVPDYDRFEGNGIYYAATAMEAQLCAGTEVIVVGGGNSAGQAAVFLSRHVSHVHILVRGPGLAATMSDYLIQRIETSTHITIHAHTEIVALRGDPLLTEVDWVTDGGAPETHAIGALFVMIGASPNSDWLDGCLARDNKGFILTGQDGAGTYATSKPGIFAVGDIRAGSVKRVASGVGEGSVVIASVHRFLDPSLA